MFNHTARLTLVFLCLITVILDSAAQAQSINQILARFFPRNPKAITAKRGDGTCLMSFTHGSGTSPTTATSILTRKPIFTWVGSPNKITVTSQWNQSEPWTETQLSSNKQSIRYTGKPLKIETDYIVRLDQPGNANITIEGTSFYFSLAPDATSQQHQKELLKIDRDFENEPEKAALAKFDYLSQQNFFFDATQELLSIPNPSLELQRDVIAYVQEKTSQKGISEEQQVITASRALQLVLSIQQPSLELQQLKNQLTQQVCPSAEANQQIEPQASPSEPKLQP